MGGFFFKNTSLKKVEKCEDLESFSFKLFYIFSTEKNKFFNNQVKRCTELKYESKLFYKLALKNTRISSYEFKKIPLDLSDKKLFIKSYKKRMRSNSGVEEFIKLIDSFFNSNDKEKSLKGRLAFLNERQQFSSKFIQYVMEILVSIEFENFERVQKNINEILKIDPNYYIFNPVFFNMSHDEILRFEKTLFKILDFISKNIRGEVSRKIFLSYFSFFNYYDKEGFNLIKEKYQVKWTLQEIREVTSKNKYNSDLILLIFSLLNKKKLYSEGIYFLKNNLDENKLVDLYFSEFSIFSFFVDDKIIKSQLFNKRLGEIINVKKSYHRFLTFELIKNKKLKKVIGQIDPIYKKANFQLEHSFFNKSIKNDQFRNFCLYKLISIGHKRSDILWWMTL